jgi:hypothetical protein
MVRAAVTAVEVFTGPTGALVMHKCLAETAANAMRAPSPGA